MGWTVDFGDVKALFDPVFKAIDHRPLFERAIDDSDAPLLARWVLAQGARCRSSIRIDVSMRPAAMAPSCWPAPRRRTGARLG